MNGQKQIFTLLLVVILVFIFMLSYFKYIRNRDKELEIQREHETNIELEQKRTEAIIKEKEKAKRHQHFLDMMKEYNHTCYWIHAITLRPEKEIPIISSKDEDKSFVDLSQPIQDMISPEVKKDKDTEDKTKNYVVSEPVIYLFLLVLIYSLIKAATDISQHFKKRKEEEERGGRRRSLQEYATVKNHVRNPKAPFIRRSTVLGVDMRPKQINKLLEERRMSRVITDINYSGLITEPGTPAKSSTGLATKPSPLLRRCSVPAFVLQNMGPNKLRRPSVESFSEDDSSPDVKRRVRMIHRH